nr:hypothetical protein [Acidobacteriota bacterium]
LQDGTLGWIWAPGQSAIFKPGDVYWMRGTTRGTTRETMRGTNLAGWGPLAIDENWEGTDTPRLYAAANTTFAKFQPGLREIDPATLAAKPKDVLTSAVFALALPSPPLVAARLEAVRPVLRAGSTRIVPFVTGESYEARSDNPKIREAAPERIAPVSQPQRAADNPQLTRTVDAPAYETEPEPDSFYPVPVYTGIVIVNPPERGTNHDRKHDRKHDVNPPPERRPYQSDLQPVAKPIPREHPGESRREPVPAEGGADAEEKPSAPSAGRRGK